VSEPMPIKTQVDLAKAEMSLAEAGPGGICEDCGHFASRHLQATRIGGMGCDFPRPEDNPCDCEGMKWQGQRVDMIRVLDLATRMGR